MSGDGEPSTDDVTALPLERKVRMMSGDMSFWSGLYAIVRRDYYHREPFRAAEVPELGLPGIRFMDGPRGVVIEGGATTFPVSMARGATWDVDLEERIGEAIGTELRALGGNLFGGVCVNLLRHPAWGRAQETYGEDPHHLGAMGSALVRGVERHAMACVKHFAVNSMENARFQVDVHASPRALHEVYLPHFKACVDAGATVIMSAYNALNGEWCGQNRPLLTEILRDRWGFEGFVITDWIFGMRDAHKAIDAGQDLEMPFRMVWADHLVALVTSGTVHEARIDQAVRRIARAQRRLPPADDYGPQHLNRPEHQALAREAATKAITLLKNDGPLLPLDPSGTLVVVGTLADRPNLGDRGSSDGRPPYVVTPLQGLRATWGERVQFVPDPEATGAADLIARADAVLAVVGYTDADEGEHIQPPDLEAFLPLMPPPEPLKGVLGWGPVRAGWKALIRTLAGLLSGAATGDGAAFGAGGDRRRLTLRPEDEALIERLAELNPRLGVAIMGGSAILMEQWKARAQAILMLWYPGMEGGHALADVLTGVVAPSGRLPFSIPSSEAHLPPLDIDATHIEYDLWHGYRLLDRDGHEPAFPFGFGLSYTTFAISDARVAPHDVGPEDTVTITVHVANTGHCSADEVVQIYLEAPDATVERAPRALVAFDRVTVEAGQTTSITIPVPVSRFATFDEGRDDFRVEPGRYGLVVACHVRDEGGKRLELRVR